IELDYQNSEKDKRAAELAAANRKLAFENHEKEARAAELLEAIAGLEAFAFISSHDLQEPVRKILLWLDQLRPAMERSFSDKEKQRFDRVIGAAYRMRQLIGDLYTYSRVNHIGQDMGKVSLNEVLAAVVEDLGPRLAETGGLVEAGDLCPAYGVRAHFGLLLEHLVDNGLKFARPGVPPRIRVAATRVAGESNPVLDPKAAYCRLIVEDNGIGFDTAGADRIFEIFQRLHAQDAYPGTGIGLALVRKITLACKGVVEVQSTPGSGSIFTLYFLLPSGFAVA
ncbi:MAG: PAS domain-containing sensor histidine kinase, partial [Sphingobacteriales bacterium]